MPTLLAYHDDERIRNLELAVGVPLAVLVAAIGAALWLSRPAARGKSRGATPILVVALVQIPLALFGQVLFAPVLLPTSLGLFAYAAVLMRRSPSTAAIAALAVSGLTAAYLVATSVACIATDGCFH